MNAVKNWQDVDKWLHRTASEAVEDWFNKQCQDLYSAYYLYYKRGGLGIYTDPPSEEWQLGSGQRISPAWPKSEALSYVKKIARHLPCLPVEISA